MPYVIGVILALGVTFATALAGLEKERGFYPTVLIVIAAYYDLFAVMGSAPTALVPETALFAVFFIAAVVGFRFNLWIVAAALAGHGLFDLVHADLVANPGTPLWWPPFCMAYDVTAAACLAWRLGRPGVLAARA